MENETVKLIVGVVFGSVLMFLTVWLVIKKNNITGALFMSFLALAFFALASSMNLRVCFLGNTEVMATGKKVDLENKKVNYLQENCKKYPSLPECPNQTPSPKYPIQLPKESTK